MFNVKQLLIFIFFTAFNISAFSQNNISITDNASHNADASAMLDVYSTSKGMLVPRMTTVQQGLISNPATGLLVFNTDVNSFFFYNGTIWTDLSDTGTDIWGVNGSTGDIYVNDLQSNIGIGTNTPLSKLAVVANAGTGPDTPLFEILDENGIPIFSVTSEGVRVYVKEYSGKGVSGGFAVGHYSSLKNTPDTTLFFVSSDSARIYTKEPTEKGIAGGFAVGRYSSLKGGTENYMHLTDNNYFIGHNAGISNTTGLYNLFLGYESGMTTNTGSENIFLGYKSGHLNQDGDRNVFLGHASGYSNVSGNYNVAIGDSAFYSSQTGHYNVVIGYRAGYTSTSSHNNTFVGAGAGKFTTGLSNTFIGNSSGLFNETGANNVALGILAGLYSGGNDNVFIGGSSGFGSGGGAGSGNIFIGAKAGYYATGDNQLFIENSNSNSPLIYGNFTDNFEFIRINGSLGVGTTPSQKLHVKQNEINSGIRIEHNTNTNYWETGVGLNSLNYKFLYNGIIVADITNSTGAYNILSDKRLKTEIQDMNSVMNKLMKLKPSYYRYINTPKNQKMSMGFIAQEVEVLFPEIVSDFIDDESGINYKGLAYDNFGVIAIKAIQEQQTQIELLGAENEELRKQIEEIRTLLEKK